MLRVRCAALVTTLVTGATLALGGCKADTTSPPPAPPSVCNGHGELCSRVYNEVAFPGTHDAYSDLADGFDAADQSYPMSRQLADGIRVLHLEIVAYQGGTYLCHGSCVFGKQLLADGLSEVGAFLGTHPDEVVTLLMESSGVTTDAVAAAVKKSGLEPSLHTQAPGARWPTLGQLIEHGDRVVAFLADMTSTGGGSYPWLLPRWTWTWETPWDNEVPADFGRCNEDRGTAGAPVYVVDTYVEGRVIPTAADAALVNVNPFLVDRLLTCKKTTGTSPTFVMVNYYEVGDVLLDVDILNGFAPAPNDDLSAFPPASWPGDAGTAPVDAGAD